MRSISATSSATRSCSASSFSTGCASSSDSRQRRSTLTSGVERQLDCAVDGARLSADGALMLLEQAELPALAAAAHAVRCAKTNERIATYVVDRNINYTNICVSGCRFCAFYVAPDDPRGYVLARDELDEKIAETVAVGGTQILMQGGLHPALRLEFFEAMLRHIKAAFPVHVHSFSPPEIVHLARLEELGVGDVLRRLRDAGLDSLPGGGAEILVEDVRHAVSPHKCTAAQWLDVMRAAHALGMRATATMMFGHVETLAQRIEHLEAIRTLQDETGGPGSGVFTAFIPWTYQPANTALGGRTVGGHDYLRTLAVSRLFLDNVDNIQASWVTQGARIASVALRFGANDLGGTMLEENVVAAAGVRFRMSIDEIRRTIADAGFEPRQRTTLYEHVEA
ncbi:MAG: dehypoxanthine futalosine cyclase [Verrucomicrobia bacterium]|nr:dehypoxanthine futalosine cyclase [Verrucomicrobiota bacterium]